MTTFYANTGKQELVEHCDAVALLGCEVLRSLRLVNVPTLNSQGELIQTIAGKMHDVGKIDPNFQQYIYDKLQMALEYDGAMGESFDPESHALHHEVSLLMWFAIWDAFKESDWFKGQLETLQLSLNRKELRELKALVSYAIYWHHAQPVRQHSLNEVLRVAIVEDEDTCAFIIEHGNSIIASLFDTSVTFSRDDLEDALPLTQAVDFIALPLLSDDGKHIEALKSAVLTSTTLLFCRHALVRADRIVSARLPSEIKAPLSELAHGDVHLRNAIVEYRDNIALKGTRSDDQLQAAHDLATTDISVCAAPAGSGKCRIALLAYEETRAHTDSVHRGILWAVPRVAVGLSILEELRTVLPTVSISIISGEHKSVYKGDEVIDIDLFDADIVITTIDQIAARLTQHRRQDELSIFLARYVVFDEYHELFMIPSLYYVTLILMKMKECQQNGHCYISGTTEPYHLALVVRHKSSVYTPITLQSFNIKPTHIRFSETYDPTQNDTLYIFNTAKKAQQMCMSMFIYENKLFDCFHAKYTSKDKEAITQNLLEKYGKHNIRKTGMRLFSGPAANASLNISRGKMVTEAAYPSSIVQRDGRKNRFAEHEKGELLILVGEKLVKEKNISKKGNPPFYVGSIKRSGIPKQTFRNGVMIPSFTHHYERMSYDFLRYIVDQFAHDDIKHKPLSQIVLDTNSNEFAKIYRKFQLSTLEGGHHNSKTHVQEHKTYIQHTIDYLHHTNRYTPTKRVVKNTLQTNEVIMSFRGDSFYGAVFDVSVDSSGKRLPIGFREITPETIKDTTAAVTEGDMPFESAVTWMEYSPAHAIKELTTSIKYRARAIGMNENEYLKMMARNPLTPLTTVNPNAPFKQGAIYISLKSDAPNNTVVGIMNLNNTNPGTLNLSEFKDVKLNNIDN